MSMTTLLAVLISVVVAGIGFWFYNRRHINSLTETIEDKNAVINSFREHLSAPVEVTTVSSHSEPPTPVTSNEFKPEKKKKRYNNRAKKATVVPPVVQESSSRRGNRTPRKNQTN